jgi:hypothetical protein
VSRLEDIGAAAGWLCWLCDEPVDPSMSVNDSRGPSLDSCITKAKAKSKGPEQERLAHRGCNTKKGAVAAVIPWAADLFLADPAPIMTSVERLERKGGREIMARCPTRVDAQNAATWLEGRVARLRPALGATTSVEAGGGQFMVVLLA